MSKENQMSEFTAKILLLLIIKTVEEDVQKLFETLEEEVLKLESESEEK